MEYLFKVSIILVLFYTCYKLFLNRETFFEANRSYLIIGLISSFLIPLVTIPIYIEIEPIVNDSIIAFDNMTQTTVIDNTLGIVTILWYIYIVGTLIFLLRFLFQLSSLVRLYTQSAKQKVLSYIYVLTKNAISPFSFFNWIVFNPEHFNKTELEQIITHEKVHASQLHSIDILLVEITQIILWFNPLVWMYKKDLRQNLEFIADKNAQATTSCKKSYQHLLLKTSVPNYQMALTNNFYNSLIKKRIVMLHKNKSKKTNQLKFLFIIPVLAIFLMSFNTKEIHIAKEQNNNIQSSIVLDLNDFQSSIDNYNFEISEALENPNKKAIKKDVVPNPKINKQDIAIYFIESTFSDSDLDNLKDKLRENGITLKIKGVKRNSDNEITAIKIDAKSKSSNANFSMSNDSTIKTIRIIFNAKDNSISIGNTSNLIHDKDYMFTPEDGTLIIDKISSKNDNVFVFRSDDKHDHDQVIIADSIRLNGNVHIKDKNVFVISEGNKMIELKVDSTQAGTFIIKKDNNGNVIKEWKDKDGNVFIHDGHDEKDRVFISKDGGQKVEIKLSGNSLWTDDNDGKVIIKSSGKSILTNDQDENISIQSIGEEKNNILISTNGKKKPLFIIDGKESTKKDLDLDPNNIESVNVLKGKAATKLYGKKGKDGVIVITTKKHKD
jgi:TonB-dependent SusC/RagA subfamily outer membrane receptor